MVVGSVTWWKKCFSLFFVGKQIMVIDFGKILVGYGGRSTCREYFQE